MGRDIAVLPDETKRTEVFWSKVGEEFNLQEKWTNSWKYHPQFNKSANPNNVWMPTP